MDGCAIDLPLGTHLFYPMTLRVPSTSICVRNDISPPNPPTSKPRPHPTSKPRPHRNPKPPPPNLPTPQTHPPNPQPLTRPSWWRLGFSPRRLGGPHGLQRGAPLGRGAGALRRPREARTCDGVWDVSASGAGESVVWVSRVLDPHQKRPKPLNSDTKQRHPETRDKQRCEHAKRARSAAKVKQASWVENGTIQCQNNPSPTSKKKTMCPHNQRHAPFKRNPTRENLLAGASQPSG